MCLDLQPGSWLITGLGHALITSWTPAHLDSIWAAFAQMFFLDSHHISSGVSTTISLRHVSRSSNNEFCGLSIKSTLVDHRIAILRRMDVRLSTFFSFTCRRLCWSLGHRKWKADLRWCFVLLNAFVMTIKLLTIYTHLPGCIILTVILPRDSQF